MRAAIYYTPAPDSAFARLGAAWLGRDPFTGLATRGADPERDGVVSEPARYGFHATLRAPFSLRPDCRLEALDEGLRVFCAGCSPPPIGRLVLARLGSFFALVPGDEEPGVQSLEAEVLRAFEPFRAPLTDAEIARRQPDRLTERQREALYVWGYPHVLDDFRFHMTLTGPLSDEADPLRRSLAAHFAAVLERPLGLSGLALFVEPAPGAPFRVHAYHSFGPATAFQPATAS